MIIMTLSFSFTEIGNDKGKILIFNKDIFKTVLYNIVSALVFILCDLQNIVLKISKKLPDFFYMKYKLSHRNLRPASLKASA